MPNFTCSLSLIWIWHPLYSAFLPCHTIPKALVFLCPFVFNHFPFFHSFPWQPEQPNALHSKLLCSFLHLCIVTECCPYEEKMQTGTELNFSFYFPALFLPSLGNLLLSIPLTAIYAHFWGKGLETAFVILHNVIWAPFKGHVLAGFSMEYLGFIRCSCGNGCFTQQSHAGSLRERIAFVFPEALYLQSENSVAMCFLYW